MDDGIKPSLSQSSFSSEEKPTGENEQEAAPKAKLDRAAGFEQFQLSTEVQRALKEMGFVMPTDIQREPIPAVFKGFDVLGQAKTGTGKTAVFGIYLTDVIDRHLNHPQALVLAPTRELAMQIAREISTISKYTGLTVATVYGGQSIEPQIRQLRQGVHVVVATPGRMLDHLERGTLNLSHVCRVVIDEADRMLDMGFIDDVRRILGHTMKGRQTMLFSATMPEEILKLSKQYQYEPMYISVSRDEPAVITHIAHQFLMVSPKTKYDALFRYLEEKQPHHTIIFCRTKSSSDKLGFVMKKKEFRACAFHGGLSQNRRDSVMKMFREGSINILVATDLAARGLDVLEVSHVINYDPPDDPITYVHRVGRTGRIGRSGTAVSLIAYGEMGLLGQIERHCKITMEEVKLTGYVAVREDDYQTFGSRQSRPERRPWHGQERQQPRRRGGFGNYRQGGGRPRR